MSPMRWVVVLLLCTALLGCTGFNLPLPGFRPPAVPLIVNDPYFSIWLASDNLTDTWPTLWDGTIKAFTGMILIDGTPYRFMGYNGGPDPMQQISVSVFPTRTVYVFQEAGVQLTLTFTTPLLPESLDLLSRPVTYLTYEVQTYDNHTHEVVLYYDNTAEIAVNNVDEPVQWAINKTSGGLTTMSVGTTTQNVLGNTGDRVGINWGYFYVATQAPDAVFTTNYADTTRDAFAKNGQLPSAVFNFPQPCDNNWIVLALTLNLSTVGPTPVSRVLVLAYDDVYSMNYFGLRLKSYWHSLYSDIFDLIDVAWNEYTDVTNQSVIFDNQVISEMQVIGGDEYATLAGLAYRQAVGGTKMTWNPEKNTTWYFMKEISSDGDVSTVDVIFPASPLFLFFNPSLLGMQLLPIFAYANNETTNPYSLVWAPHHLGTWPVANITTGQQENMPIEETGNLILMVTAIAQMTGYDEVLQNPAYWNLLQQWGDYLVSALPDPGDQLCTDDFEGPTPHDANLAVKGIIGIAAFAELNQIIGNSTAAAKYQAIAVQFMEDWLTLANPTNNSHYRLRYDEPGWSLKYNMLWQYLLDIPLYPASVMAEEIDYYLDHLHPYGIPLDVRADFSKLDWQSWVAAMAADPADFALIINGIYQFAQYTPQRVPLTDWYYTTQPNQSGFQARTVVGGLWAKALLTKLSQK